MKRANWPPGPRTIASGTSPYFGFPRTGSNGVRRISLINSASNLCTPSSLFTVLALHTPPRVPITTSSERSCTPRKRPSVHPTISTKFYSWHEQKLRAPRLRFTSVPSVEQVHLPVQQLPRRALLPPRLPGQDRACPAKPER